jgi:hypothetical protein
VGLQSSKPEGIQAKQWLPPRTKEGRKGNTHKRLLNVKRTKHLWKVPVNHSSESEMSRRPPLPKSLNSHTITSSAIYKL